MMGERNRECSKKTLQKGVISLMILLALGQTGGEARAQEVGTEVPGSAETTEGDEESTEQLTPEPTPEPTPVPTPTSKYVLQNSAAKYKKGGQTGIHYHKVSGRKVYHLHSYTTDTVSLVMSHASTYSVYGGGSKKEVKKQLVTVSSKGIVKCHRREPGQKLYTIIQAKSKETGEEQYIYIYFHKKITSKAGKRISLYEKKEQVLSFDYAKKNLHFSVKNKKVATVDAKGKVRAKKKGTTELVVKVKGSQKNYVRIKIVVKVEPWIVNDKDTLYDYNDMTTDIHGLAHKYPGKLGYYSLGKTYDNRQIWCLRIGKANAPKKLVIDAAIHAREWLNTQVLMRHTEQILRDYGDYQTRFHNVCVYIIPMDNPDGVSISQYGYQAIRNPKLQKKVKKIGHFSRWKNNARGVNINNNFPAGFKKSKKAKKGDWVFYSGKKAGSEKETKALMKFVEKTKPNAVINLHSTGSIIYWDFNVGGNLHQKLYYLASKVNSFNKYRMMPKSSSTSKAGGFADWLVYEKQIPSITIETGNVSCPLPHSQYKKIYGKNSEMLTWFMTKY